MSTELQNVLLYTQIIISVLFVISILLQNRAEGLEKMFGGGGEKKKKKRGLEKFLYYFTIALVVLLVITSLLIYKYSV